MKKVNKNSPALHSNSPAQRWVFGGQTAPSPAHCEHSAQIICIGLDKQANWSSLMNLRLTNKNCKMMTFNFKRQKITNLQIQTRSNECAYLSLTTYAPSKFSRFEGCNMLKPQLSMYKYPIQLSNVKVSNAKHLKPRKNQLGTRKSNRPISSKWW